MMMDMKLLVKPQLLTLLAAISRVLAEREVESYLVGGFVRDVVLGRETSDIDIAVAQDAPEIASRIAGELGGKDVLLDEVNRVARVIMDDGEWQVDLATFTGGIEQDLARRDFTIDAMAVDLSRITAGAAGVQVIDPFGGLADIERGVIRAVTETAFEVDAVRLLRALRLAAELGFSIDSQTEDIIRRCAYLISGVAGERIREELLRLLAVSQPGQFLPYFDGLGLLTALIPELVPLKGVEQPREHFRDVFGHTLAAVEAVDFILRRGDWEYAGDEVLAVVPWSNILAEYFEQEVSSGSTRRLMLKMAALLHDTAKPQTKTVEASGKIRFLGHGEEGAVIAADVLERLRFSTREIKLAETIVKHHLRPGQMSNVGLPTARAIYRYFRDTGDAGIDILFFSLADHLATRGPHLEREAWFEHAQTVAYVMEQRSEQASLVTPPKLVDGHDLMSIFGMKPGPGMGGLLEAVREAQAAGEVTTREEALSYIREHLLSKGVNVYG